ncbi:MULTISPECIES: DUF1841 family protein [Leeia]|uniref:DUF1841 family protein n=1 Tax=Leeia aquatica TaxID=2725557 RepID=A0A847S405_9NEIS|nr:DUF1841 family protein [Leeia aquatica]NLR74484.1 DUF1841 family protein [Leeia aquatica]
MFDPSRDQARQFLFDTWRKHHDGLPLTPLEAMALDVIGEHPEYHAILSDPDRYLTRDYPAEQGEPNPFLHLMMHLSIREQLSIDQPPGVRAHFHRLCLKLGSEHEAVHAFLDCFGEMLWHAQRYQTMPDPAIYLDCLSRK